MGIVTIDDHDGAVIYSGVWHSYPSSQEYMNSASWTANNGSQALVSFHGTKILVVGTIGMLGQNDTVDRSTSSFTIDNLKTSSWYIATPTQDLQYQTIFFESDELASGQHSLVIQNLKGSLYLDYFLVTTLDNPTATQTRPTNASDIFSTTTPSLSTDQRQSKKYLPGVIAVAVLFAVTNIVFAIGFAISRRRRRVRNQILDAFPVPPRGEWQMSQTPLGLNPVVATPFHTSNQTGATIIRKGVALFQFSSTQSCSSNNEPVGLNNNRTFAPVVDASNIRNAPPSYSVS